MLDTIYTISFKKDYKKVKKQGKDLNIINSIIYNLSHRISLDKKYKDHLLVGNYKNKRECHLLPNWLLVYEIDNNNLVLHRTGSHSELFKK